MELYFETYLIITLLFTILTICIAGSFLKNKKYTIGFSAFVVFLGFIIPYSLLAFQWIYGSLGEISQMNRTILENEDICKGIKRYGGIPKPMVLVAFDSFTHTLGFIVLVIAIGIALGILIHLLLKKQERKTKISC
jgi:hypothetical protein